MNKHQQNPTSGQPHVRAPMSRRPLWRRALARPSTSAGWWSVGLAAAFFCGLGIAQTMVLAGQRGGDTFFDNPWLGTSMLVAESAGIGAGVAAAVAIVIKAERSPSVFGALLLGLLLLIFVIGELATAH
ncbi:MAG TPA: hypothetical protein VFU22_17990 [Roseiflexaceae bacterium]|nr:hypothetical protein [Roseiflexaceae bacterium]